MKTWVKVLIGVVVAAILAVTAGPFIYINFIKDDAPDKLSLDDVPSSTDPPSTDAVDVSEQVSTTTIAPSTTSGDASVTTGTGAPAASGVDGSYTVTTGSQAGYRVVEVLFGQDTEGVGRTENVTGSMTISGTQVTAAEFTVDMTSVTSDESRRDNQFQGRIMETDQFPTATFVITQPIELGTVPEDGQEITATATGDLTLHGVTNSVTLEVTAKRTGDSVAVAGSTDVVFADYDIANPSTNGITTQDHGLIEFLLVFAHD